VSQARIRPDGTVLVSSDGSRLDAIDRTGNPLVEQRHPVEPFANVVLADGRAVAVVETDGNPVVTDLASGEQTAMQLITPDGDDFASVFAVPIGNAIVASDGRQVVALWEDGSMVDRIDLGGVTLTGAVNDDRLAILGQQPDGTRVASLLHIAPDDIELLTTVPAPLGISVRPSPDGGMFVFGSDGTVSMFDSTGRQGDVLIAEGGDALVTAVDGSSGLLAMASDSQGIGILDRETGEIEPLPGDDLVAGLGFARSGELLIITRVDGSVRIWDIDRGENSGVVPIGSGAKLLSPLWYDALTDSMWISTSGNVTRVSLDPQRWVQRACETVDRELTADERDRFVPGDAPPEPACG
jgi:WD40 repeat protein